MSADPDRVLGRVTVLAGVQGGKYPHGNSLLVTGSEETALIDPSLSLAGRPERAHVDRLLLSHCHEDHIAGNPLFPDAACHVHPLDRPGLQSLDGMMAIYGFTGPIDTAFRQVVVDQFHWAPRLDAVPLADGQVLDLGRVRVRVIHAPGHTRGHCLLHVEPGDVLYLGDIDLSSFGPYYGDAWSSLADFERTLAMVRTIDARWYATFHHIGVLDGRAAFLERLDRFTAVIASREARLLAFLEVPHTLDEIAAHRFVYRPGDPVSFADPVERRSMAQHLTRLVDAGRVVADDAGRYAAR